MGETKTCIEIVAAVMLARPLPTLPSYVKRPMSMPVDLRHDIMMLCSSKHEEDEDEAHDRRLLPATQQPLSIKMAAQSVMAAHTPIAGLRSCTALVTGGASGIGAATARKLASRGINVMIADVAAKAGEQLADDIKAEFKVDSFFRQVDVSKEAEIVAMVTAIVEKWGRLDYAANVAGICKDGGDLKDDESKVPTQLIDKYAPPDLPFLNPKLKHI